MYLEIDTDLPDHPKSVRIGVLLANPVAWAYVQKLWIFACKYQKDGDLSAYGVEEIERFAGWAQADGAFYAAAVKVGFIDELDSRRSLHNWAERQGKWLVKMETDRRRKADGRASVQRMSSGRPADVQRTGHGQVADSPTVVQRTSNGQVSAAPAPVHRTDPVPHLTSPDLTKPNLTAPANGVSDPDVPRIGLDLIRLFCRLWERRWNLLFVQKQWDASAADALVDGAPEPTRRELKPAIEAYLESEDEKYIEEKHPFKLFARDLDKFRGGRAPGRRKPRELELA